MPGPLPEGEPTDGSLPTSARGELADAGALSWYFHVPFCRSRCGYCDFNTYTNAELGGGASVQRWASTAIAEVRLARAVLGDVDAPAATIFFGGGTPTRLPTQAIGEVIAAVSQEFGVSPGAEVTVEANPDDLDNAKLAGLVDAGATRVSVGMQSAVPQTLAILERTHRADYLPHVAERIRRSGIAQWSLDLIYGTPGESADQWRHSLEVAIGLAPDHISAYCLGIEEGTRLGAKRRIGAIPDVDPDEAADRYVTGDRAMSAAGYGWYEISNWSKPGAQSRHNLAYWRGGHWWGVGPGAHSHIGGVRWWNVRHPRDWTSALSTGRTPAAAREVLTEQQRLDERIMLGLRLAEGLRASDVGEELARQWVGDGLAVWSGEPGRFRLAPTGRLIADRLALQAVTAAATNLL